ncbi:hypothetical protein [Calothrix sp. CCY 0018]|uniref:hypothetical protein n=1 Tax=Calothrix sp. CCY 0018 TaxID=3103864 RepID=UPI0039C75B4A
MLKKHSKKKGAGNEEALGNELAALFYLVLGIVTQTHGGNLYCLFSPGNGAEFVIELPLDDSEQ